MNNGNFVQSQNNYTLLFVDENIIAVDKPSGLLSIPDGYKTTLPCLSQYLKQIFNEVWVVHRLDKETSGVIVFARNREAHAELNRQFQTRVVQKTYHALITGTPSWNSINIDANLKVNGTKRHHTIIDQNHGKPAKTQINVIARMADTTLVEAHPHTGYTHQIRAHLAYIGFPIVGDHLYHSIATRLPALTATRLMLHAKDILFTHPQTKTPLALIAPYPLDFVNVIHQYLK